MFLTPQELSLIQRDSVDIFSSGNSSQITIHFSAWDEDLDPEFDDVYNEEEVESEENFTLENVKCIIQLKSSLKFTVREFAEDYKLDALFYFPYSTRFDNIKPGYTIRKNSYRFTEESTGITWIPQIHNLHEYEELIRMIVGGKNLMAVIPCLKQ